jgi:hypothetical protein
MPNAFDAQITVVFPIIDVRGRAANHVRRWTHQQTLPRECYRVVAASNDATDPQIPEVAPLLGPHDELFHAPGAHRMVGLWNAGAKRARTPWLVIVEGHSLANPDCLAAVARWIVANPSAHAGNFTVGHLDRNLLARLSKPWFDMIHAGWRSPAEWPRLIGSGFAIRRDIFEAAGGFEAEYDLFAVHLLAARLHARGISIEVIPDATVIHIDDETMRDHHFDTARFVFGEMEARSQIDPVFFARYFGAGPLWANQLRGRPRIALRMAKSVVAAAMAYPKRTAELAGLLGPLAVATVVSDSMRVALVRLAVALEEVAVERLPLPTKWRWTTFLRAHSRVVRLTQIEWRRRRKALPAFHRSVGRCPIERLGPGAIIGVHGLESHNGRPFHWTEPVVLLRIAPYEAEFELRIETVGIRGDPLAAVIAVVVNGRVLPRELLSASEDGTLVVRLPEPWSAAARGGIVLVCSPLVPARTGSPDPRRLGLPILSIASVLPHGSVGTGKVAAA